MSKDLPAIDTRHGNEEGVVKFLYPLLPKVYVSAMEDNMLLRNNRVYVDRLLSAALNRCRMDAPRPAPTRTDDTTKSTAVSEEKTEKDNPEAARRAKAKEFMTNSSGSFLHSHSHF